MPARDPCRPSHSQPLCPDVPVDAASALSSHRKPRPATGNRLAGAAEFSDEEAAPRFLAVKQETARHITISDHCPRSSILVDRRRDQTRPRLNHKASFSETHPRNPDRVVIEVNNAILGKSSRQRVSGGTIPPSFQIAQSRPRAITITLPRAQGSTYKAFTLANPDRLVIDIYQRPKDRIRHIGETSTTGPSTAIVALPTPPAIPSPTVTEPTRPIAPKPATPMRTIVIDPGHGGKDPGTIGHHGTTEKDVTLKVGLLLKTLTQFLAEYTGAHDP